MRMVSHWLTTVDIPELLLATKWRTLWWHNCWGWDLRVRTSLPVRGSSQLRGNTVYKRLQNGRPRLIQYKLSLQKYHYSTIYTQGCTIWWLLVNHTGCYNGSSNKPPQVKVQLGVSFSLHLLVRLLWKPNQCRHPVICPPKVTINRSKPGNAHARCLWNKLWINWSSLYI